MLIAFILSSIYNSDFSGIALIISNVMSFLVVILIVSAVKQDNHLFYFFSKLWLIAAIVSSLLSLLQFLDILGYYNLSVETQLMREGVGGFNRGVALKRDPNFLALLLALSVPLAFHLRSHRRISGLKLFISLAIILIGIICTQSRMGIILYFIAMAIWSIIFNSRSIASLFKLCALIVGFSILFFSFAPQTVKSGLEGRFIELQQTITSGLVAERNNNGNVTSSTARLILLYSGFKAANERFIFGWGVGNTKKAISQYSAIDLDNVAHNTYLEFYIVFGFFGVVFMIYYLFINFPEKRMSNENHALCKTIYITFFVACLFLSNIYTSILWIPLLIKFSLHDNNLSRCRVPSG